MYELAHSYIAPPKGRRIDPSQIETSADGLVFTEIAAFLEI